MLQVRDQLPGGLRTLRSLASLAAEGRERGMGASELSFELAYERLNVLLERE